MLKFIGTAPDFSLPVELGLEPSPYYWWWRYLRNNADYIATCTKNGSGSLAEIYEDFGDVRDDNFQRWWGREGINHGRIFAERSELPDGKLLESTSDWEPFMGPYPYVVIAVDMRYGLETAKEDAKRLLQERFQKGAGGRPPINKRFSTAKRRLTKNVNVETYKYGLMLYEFFANRCSQGLALTEQDLWEAGEAFEVDVSLIPRKIDSDARVKDKRQQMAEKCAALLGTSTKMVALTSTGYFPAPRPKDFDAIDAYIEQERDRRRRR